MNDSAMSLWVDGEAASAAALAVPALLNYGHFTAMQVRDGAVRGRRAAHHAEVRVVDDEGGEPAMSRPHFECCP
jgi:hypothetical protein